MDYKIDKENPDSSSSSNFKKNKSKVKKGNWGKEGKKQKGDKGKEKVDADSSKLKNNPKFQGCFLCNGPHCAKDCPNREKLNAIIVEERQGDKEVPALVNPL